MISSNSFSANNDVRLSLRRWGRQLRAKLRARKVKEFNMGSNRY